MLTAKDLRGIAAELEYDAETATDDAGQRAQLGRWAADLRQTADAGSGFGTPETLALVIVIDNDRPIAERRMALVAQAMDNAYSDVPEDADAETIARLVEENDAARVSDLADALSAMVEDVAGFEGWKVRGDAETTHYLPDTAHALARAAFRNVDWRGLAEHYITEHRLGQMADEVSR